MSFQSFRRVRSVGIEKRSPELFVDGRRFRVVEVNQSHADVLHSFVFVDLLVFETVLIDVETRLFQTEGEKTSIDEDEKKVHRPVERRQRRIALSTFVEQLFQSLTMLKRNAIESSRRSSRSTTNFRSADQSLLVAAQNRAEERKIVALQTFALDFLALRLSEDGRRRVPRANVCRLSLDQLLDFQLVVANQPRQFDDFVVQKSQLVVRRSTAFVENFLHSLISKSTRRNRRKDATSRFPLYFVGSSASSAR